MNLRPSGIDVVGEIPWTTHFCQLYVSWADLLEVVAPYFAAGLAGNERCMWRRVARRGSGVNGRARGMPHDTTSW
jgi:hypothetical protein